VRPNELIRLIRKRHPELEIDAGIGKGSHARLRLGGRTTFLPLHNREIPTGTLHGILRALGLRLDQLR